MSSTGELQRYGADPFDEASEGAAIRLSDAAAQMARPVSRTLRSLALHDRGAARQAVAMSSSAHVLEPPFFAFVPVRTGVFGVLSEQERPQAKVVTITAPTGYGKTVLLTSLYERYRKAGTLCRWLSLDDRDVSVERVTTHLESALLTPASQVNLQQALHQGDEPLQERITSLLESLSLTANPMVVFIDNLNFCTDETLGRLLDALIFRTPSWVQLVLSSTVTLPFDQARAKLEGRLLAFGFGELSLNREEILGLLGIDLAARLTPRAIDAIESQSEGWPAAVRLMQIVLTAADRPEQALTHFSGADEYLAELLNRQVLSSFDERARTFLLETSLLRTFGVNLCRHATGDDRAAQHIGSLLKRNLFVIPLDRNRSWYRLHGLFREFLVDEAQRVIPAERRREVLARAAEWCEHGGHWHDAIEYALASDSVPLAAAVLERVAAMFVRDRGDLHQYIEWVEKLHATGAQCGWEADFWYVWALVFHRRYEYARRQTERLSRRVDAEVAAGTAAGDVTEFRRRIEVVLIAIDVYTDRLQDVHPNALRWLQDTRDDDPFNVATVASAASIQVCAEYRLVEARKVIRVAQSHIAQAASDYGVGWVNLLSSMIQLQEGDYVTAHQDLLAALTRARAALGESAGIVGTISMLAAKSAIEMNLDAEARDLLVMGLKKATQHGVVDTAACGLDAAVKFWSGASDDPISIPQLREIASSYPPRLAVMLSCFLIRRLLRMGRQEEALIEAAQIGLNTAEADHVSSQVGVPDLAILRDLLAATQIDLHIVGGRLKQAAAMVAAETRLAKAEDRAGRLVELALDEAAISLCTHNPAPAVRHIARAVSLAARRRYLRPFRDRAEMLAGIVNETKAKDWGFAVEEERRFFAEICRGLPLTNSALLEQLDDLNVTSALTETPTARELELLSLIEAGLSNQQLADRLSVSVATVKWHLYNLYTKLGVSSRSAAIARARALNVLSR
ncbi:MAG TPA: LuxR C-terminal-related transcriptional regulator [Solimonas sp.]|nr:LuxR C-terminal-related transcriptional regulator [Solimonas sp.]